MPRVPLTLTQPRAGGTGSPGLGVGQLFTPMVWKGPESLATCLLPPHPHPGKKWRLMVICWGGSFSSEPCSPCASGCQEPTISSPWPKENTALGHAGWKHVATRSPEPREVCSFPPEHWAPCPMGMAQTPRGQRG